MSENDAPILVLVAGVDGSGKETFSRLFKNSFLQSLPRLPLYQGLLSGLSFFAVTDFSSPDDIRFLKTAKRKGYRIVSYVLFSARSLCVVRNRIQALSKGIMWDSSEFRDAYESFFDSMVLAYPLFESVFFVENQKAVSFVGAYSVDETPATSFEKALRSKKAEVNRLRKK